MTSLPNTSLVILCFLLALLILPIYFLFLSPFVLLRLVLSVHFRIFHGNKFKLCSSNDSAYGNDLPGRTVQIFTFLYVKGQTDINKLIDRIETQLLNHLSPDGNKTYERLTWKLIQKHGYHVWEVDNNSFDIRDHVKTFPELDHSEDYNEDQIMQAVSRTIDTPMSPKYPQWEFYYVPQVKLASSEDIHYALVFRVQHAYMDGISIVQLIRCGLADKPAQNLIIDPLKSPFAKLSCLQKAFLYTKAVVYAPYTYLHSVSTLRSVFSNVHDPSKHPTGPKFIKSSSKLLTVDTIRKLRKRFGVSTSAILVALVVEALRKAAARKLLPIPEEIDFYLTSASFPYPNIKPQNRFAMKLSKVPMKPFENIKNLEEISKALKSTPLYEILSLSLLGSLVGVFPARMTRRLNDFIKAGFMMSSLPGFEDKLKIFGESVECFSGVPPLIDTAGFGIGIVSYAGSFRVSWIVEKSQIISNMEEMNSLIDDFDTEVENLIKEA